MSLKEILEAPVLLRYDMKAGQKQPAQKALLLARNDFKNFVPVGYKIRVSGSAVNIPEIPWISILNPELTTTTQAGLYLVYLYSADLTALYISMNQGYTRHRENAENNGFKGKNAAQEALVTLNSESKDIVKILKNENLIPDNAVLKINLKSESELPKGYESGHIVGFRYETNNLPPESELQSNLDLMLSIYDAVKEANDSLRINSPKNRITMSRNIASKETSVFEEKLVAPAFFEPRNREEYVANYARSMYKVSPLHEALINQFAEYATTYGWTPLNKKIQQRDLVLKDGSGFEILIEAKTVGKSQEDVVRQAIGQLFSYRYVYYQGEDIPLIALFNREISTFWQGLLGSLGIKFIFFRNNSWDGTGLELIKGKKNFK
jgi:hypothetical protein